MTGTQRTTHQQTTARRGVTLIEVLTVMTVMGVLLAMAVPSFNRTMEQAHADVAAANLRAIWNAQRFFWLENRTYATDLGQLQQVDLLDPTLTASSPRYNYAVAGATDDTFTVSATRVGSSRWRGGFAIDEMGLLTGALEAEDETDLIPGYQ